MKVPAVVHCDKCRSAQERCPQHAETPTVEIDITPEEVARAMWIAGGNIPEDFRPADDIRDAS